MRHAKDVGYTEETTIIPEKSQEVIIRVMADLAFHIRGMGMKRVEVVHSPLKRAELTARYSANLLLSHEGLETSVSPISWLNCRIGIKDYLIEALLPSDPETFVLLIGHQPDIAEYLGYDEHEEMRLTNCSICSANFHIRG